MKTRLYIGACVFISFSIFSCSTDDIDEQTQATDNNVKKEVTNIVNDNVYGKIKNTISTSTYATEGDPIIIKPPRKD